MFLNLREMSTVERLLFAALSVMTLVFGIAILRQSTLDANNILLWVLIGGNNWGISFVCAIWAAIGQVPDVFTDRALQRHITNPF